MANINETIWQINPPTERGQYEYRWIHGTKRMKSEWTRVVVYLKDGVLLVNNPTHSHRQSPV